MTTSTYVIRRLGSEPMYVRSFKVARRIASEEASRGTMVGRIQQDGTVSFLRPR